MYMKKGLMFAAAVATFALTPMTAVSHKAVWIESLGAFDGPVRESIRTREPLLHLAETRDRSDLVLKLSSQGSQYSQALLREKLGRQDTMTLVAQERINGKVVASQRVTPNAEGNRNAVDRFTTKLAELP